MVQFHGTFPCFGLRANSPWTALRELKDEGLPVWRILHYAERRLLAPPPVLSPGRACVERFETCLRPGPLARSTARTLAQGCHVALVDEDFLRLILQGCAPVGLRPARAVPVR